MIPKLRSLKDKIEERKEVVDKLEKLDDVIDELEGVKKVKISKKKSSR